MNAPRTRVLSLAAAICIVCISIVLWRLNAHRNHINALNDAVSQAERRANDYNKAEENLQRMVIAIGAIGNQYKPGGNTPTEEAVAMDYQSEAYRESVPQLRQAFDAYSAVIGQPLPERDRMAEDVDIMAQSLRNASVYMKLYGEAPTAFASYRPIIHNNIETVLRHISSLMEIQSDLDAVFKRYDKVTSHALATAKAERDRVAKEDLLHAIETP